MINHKLFNAQGINLTYMSIEYMLMFLCLCERNVQNFRINVKDRNIFKFPFFSVFETGFFPVSDIVIVTCIKSSRTVTFDTNACISKKMLFLILFSIFINQNHSSLIQRAVMIMIERASNRLEIHIKIPKARVP